MIEKKNKRVTKLADRPENERNTRAAKNDSVYINNFTNNHYRGFGLKINPDREEDVVSWLDHQKELTPYLMKIIKEDMLKPENLDELNKARIENIKFKQMQYSRQVFEDEEEIPLVCEKCKRRIYISGKTFSELRGTKLVQCCPSCKGVMHAFNYNPKEVCKY